jgi:hypothetical protein
MKFIVNTIKWKTALFLIDVFIFEISEFNLFIKQVSQSLLYDFNSKWNKMI